MQTSTRHLTGSISRSSTFLLGQDSRGHWVVQDKEGLCGGIFLERADALKFAMFDTGGHPRAVILLPGIVELDIGGTPKRRAA